MCHFALQKSLHPSENPFTVLVIYLLIVVTIVFLGSLKNIKETGKSKGFEVCCARMVAYKNSTAPTQNL